MYPFNPSYVAVSLNLVYLVGPMTYEHICHIRTYLNHVTVEVTVARATVTIAITPINTLVTGQ